MKTFPCLFSAGCVIFLTLASMPVAFAVVPAPPELTNALKDNEFQKSAAILVTRIDAIQKTKFSAATKTNKIAVLTAQAIDALGERCKPVLADMVGTLNADALATVTASTVIVTGTKSPPIIKNMSAGLGEFSEKLSIITTAASDPGSVLDKATLRQIAPPVVTRKKVSEKITVDPSPSRYEGQN